MPVEDNDPRLLNIVTNSNFANTLATQTTPKNYVFKENIIISGNVVVPAHLTFEPADGAKFLKSGTGTLTFLGQGVGNPLSEHPYFSGFAAGEVKFTGIEYPRRISAQLFEAPSLSKSIRIATDAFKHPSDWNQNKRVEIHCRPGHFDTTTVLRRFSSLLFYPGEFTNSFHDMLQGGDIPLIPIILLEGDHVISGFGASSVIHGSNEVAVWSVNGQKYEAEPTVIMPVSQFPSRFNNNGAPYPQRLSNVTIKDLHFQGPKTRVDGQEIPAVSVGSCHNGHIINCSFDNWEGYSANIGKTGDSILDVATSSSIRNCTFTRTGYHVAAIINSRNCKITGNISTRHGNVKYEASGIATTAGASFVTVPAISHYEMIQNVWAVFTHRDAVTGVETIYRTPITGSAPTSATRIDLTNPLPNNSIWTSSGVVKIELVRLGGHCVDTEPNAGFDINDSLEITNNIFDCTEAKMQNLWGIFVQGVGTPTGCRNVVIRENQIIAARPSNAGNLEKQIWLDKQGANLIWGIYVSDAESCEIVDNTIQGSINTSVLIQWGYNHRILRNEIINHFPFAADRAVALIGVCDSFIEDNKLIGWQGFSSTNKIWEDLRINDGVALTERGRISISGTSVTNLSGAYFRWWWAGRQLKIGGSNYTIQSVTSASNLTLTTAPAQQGDNGGAGFGYWVNFSNNRYRNNDAIVQLHSDSTSKIAKFYTEDELIALIQANSVGTSFTFTDNFNRADGSVGNNWSSITTGYFSPKTPLITSNQLAWTNNAVGGILRPNSLLNTRQEVKLVSVPGAGGVVLLARMQNDQNCYFAAYENHPPARGIYKLVNNFMTKISADITRTPTANDVMRFTVNGSSLLLEILVGDVVVDSVQVTDTTFTTVGKCGVADDWGGSTVDNYILKEL